MNTNKTPYDIIIIGGGPTGISIAIEAKRNGLQALILEKGVLVNSLYHFPTNMTFFSTSLNLEIGGVPFISHNEKPTRMEALEYYRRVLEAWELDIDFGVKAQGIEKKDNLFHILTDLDTYTADYVVLATGFYDHYRPLNVAGESLPKVKHYYDDVHPYIRKKVVVVGGANSACDVALETWSKGAEVTMVVRDESLYRNVKYWILPNIENRINEGSIKAYFNSEIVEIKDKEVSIKSPEGLISLENDYVLAMTGYMPDYKFLAEMGISWDDSNEKIPTHDPDTLESNVPGIYLAGVLNGGMHTSKYFIENTRWDGEKIVKDILSRSSLA